jgi:hypothetical protein
MVLAITEPVSTRLRQTTMVPATMNVTGIQLAANALLTSGLPKGVAASRVTISALVDRNQSRPLLVYSPKARIRRLRARVYWWARTAGMSLRSDSSASSRRACTSLRCALSLVSLRASALSRQNFRPLGLCNTRLNHSQAMAFSPSRRMARISRLRARIVWPAWTAAILSRNIWMVLRVAVSRHVFSVKHCLL